MKLFGITFRLEKREPLERPMRISGAMTAELATEILGLDRQFQNFQLDERVSPTMVKRLNERQTKIRHEINALTWRECLARAYGYFDRVWEGERHAL